MTQWKRVFALAAALALAPALAQGAEKAVFAPSGNLKWINAGVPR